LSKNELELGTRVTQTADDYFRLGLEHNENGQHKQAIDAYTQAIRLNPSTLNENDPTVLSNMYPPLARKFVDA